ncbi:MAG TPA: phosphatase PAP2 family protein [Dermatophilaceae bacterium]
MAHERPALPGVGETAHPWAFSRTQWIWVVVVLAAIGLVFYSYELLNGAPPANRWPGYYAARPATGQLVQPLTGSEPYQTFVLKSWLDAKVPFLPLLAIPYLSFLVIVPIVVPLLNLAAGSFRRFLTVGLALIVSQLVLDVAYYLFQTYVFRDVRAGDGLGGWLVNQVWGNDQPFNGYPSGHCTWTTIGILALWRLRHRLPKTSWILMAWLCLVYPATVSLRQHYLMDVYAGIFVGFACYWACMFAVERPRLVPRDELPLGPA